MKNKTNKRRITMNRILQGKRHIITGIYTEDRHNGIDLVATTNGTNRVTDNITAHSDGVIKEIRKGYATTDTFGNSYGNYVLIEHANGMATCYAHLVNGSNSSLSVGDKVRKGQVIGRMGSTGRSTGAHLHFEVRSTTRHADRIDPTNYLNNDIVKEEEKPLTNFKLQDKVKLKKGAMFIGGQSPAAFLFGAELFVRDIRENGNVVVSTLSSGAITGTFSADNLELVSSAPTSKPVSAPVSTPATQKETVLRVGDKVMVSGEVSEYGNGNGNVNNYSKKLMYVIEILDQKQYKNNIGVALRKNGARNGWTNTKFITRG